MGSSSLCLAAADAGLRSVRVWCAASCIVPTDGLYCHLLSHGSDLTCRLRQVCAGGRAGEADRQHERAAHPRGRPDGCQVGRGGIRDDCCAWRVRLGCRAPDTGMHQPMSHHTAVRCCLMLRDSCASRTPTCARPALHQALPALQSALGSARLGLRVHACMLPLLCAPRLTPGRPLLTR